MRTDRRTVLAGGVVLGAASLLAAPRWPAMAAPGPAFRLSVARGEAGLVAPDGPPTAAWLYNGTAPGPVLRAQQGETLSVNVENRLDEPTTVHWHGLRVPVEMDGVPFLSQRPIAPGETFDYRLPLHDAGTFWYHPHINSAEQVGRGLNGVLIVEEPPEIAARLRADREVIWVIDDWRLDAEAQLVPFGGFHDMSHAGRLGNVLTFNGSYRTEATWRAGERIRLRLANVSNARTLHLRFRDLDPWVVALDGHPVPPRTLDGGIWLGAGQRADLVVDVTLDPGAQARVIDDAEGADRAFEVMQLDIAEVPPVREAALPPPAALPANPILTPDLSSAAVHRLVFEGGAMGGMHGAMMGERMLGMRELAEAGRMWAINGTVPEDLYRTEPLFRATQGQTQVVLLENRTRWLHPIHLHGHSFHVLGPGNDPLADAVIRDTVLLEPEGTARIAFVADNPGQWMLHCHVLEHQGAGMMGVVAVG